MQCNGIANAMQERGIQRVRHCKPGGQGQNKPKMTESNPKIQFWRAKNQKRRGKQRQPAPDGQTQKERQWQRQNGPALVKALAADGPSATMQSALGACRCPQRQRPCSEPTASNPGSPYGRPLMPSSRMRCGERAAAQRHPRWPAQGRGQAGCCPPRG